jgi:outer membrane protein assembly factor BamB
MGSNKSPIEISGDLLWTLDNPNAYSTPVNDWFGFSVGISESYAIVGAYTEDDAGGTESGKAYIFDNTTGALLWTLNNPNAYSTSTGDWFGSSVGISETYAIVGAYTEDDAGGTNSGKAYIFNPATGSLLWTLNDPNAYGTSAGDWFGYSVAISESYAIVGAYFEDDAGGTESGKAYIFNPATGALLWTLDNPNAYDTSSYDYFGYSVGISESYAIVSAYGEDEGADEDSGKAYIFNPATGALLWTLDNPNAYSTSTGDWFGSSVGISESHAIVGAKFEDDAGGTDSGKAYIFI